MFIVVIVLTTFLIIIGTLHSKLKLTRIYNTNILFCKIVNLYSLPIHLLYNIICIYILYTQYKWYLLFVIKNYYIIRA